MARWHFRMIDKYKLLEDIEGIVYAHTEADAIYEVQCLHCGMGFDIKVKQII